MMKHTELDKLYFWLLRGTDSTRLSTQRRRSVHPPAPQRRTPAKATVHGKGGGGEGIFRGRPGLSPRADFRHERGRAGGSTGGPPGAGARRWSARSDARLATMTSSIISTCVCVCTCVCVRACAGLSVRVRVSEPQLPLNLPAQSSQGARTRSRPPPLRPSATHHQGRRAPGRQPGTSARSLRRTSLPARCAAGRHAPHRARCVHAAGAPKPAAPSAPRVSSHVSVHVCVRARRSAPWPGPCRGA